MEELASDKNATVCEALACNPAIANYPEIIKQLASDKNATVCEALACNPAIANYPEIIKQLASDKDPRVRYALAENPAIPTRTARTNSWQATQPVTQTTTI